MDNTAKDVQIKEAIQECIARLQTCGGDGSGSVPAAAATAVGKSESAEDDSECDDRPDLVEESDSDDEGPHFIYDGDGDVAGVAPRMPCAAAMRAEHREKLIPQGLYNACVARPV